MTLLYHDSFKYLTTLIFISLVFLFGCHSTYLMYQGPILPEENVAVLKITVPCLIVRYLDDNKIVGSSGDQEYPSGGDGFIRAGDEIILIPGSHTITIFYSCMGVYSSYNSTEDLTISFTVLPGKKYILDAAVNKPYFGSGSWRAWIVQRD